MTVDEFKAEYARQGGVTESQLDDLGYIVVPVEATGCDYAECQGYHMLTRHSIEDGAYNALEAKGLGLPYPSSL